MKFRAFSLVWIALLGLATAAAAQRVEFQRQKFDRSRFQHAGQSAATSAEAEPAAEPVGTLPSASMPTEAPVSTSQSSVFSYSNSPSTSWDSPSSPASSATNTSIFSADAPPLSGRPPATYPSGATAEEKAAIDNPLFDQVPSKWFNNAKDYEELLALQKKTGACMLVYFKNPSVPNEKGLCSWFEKRITTDIAWRKAMKYFIKLEIDMPGPSAVRDLVALYKVTHTPAIFVIQPGSTMRNRLMVFEYSSGNRPKPIEVPVVLEALKSRCTPAYGTLF